MQFILGAISISVVYGVAWVLHKEVKVHKNASADTVEHITPELKKLKRPQEHETQTFILY